MIDLREIYQKNELTQMAKNLYKEERLINRLDGWFLAKEIEMNNEEKYIGCNEEVKKAYLLCDVVREIPLFISENAIFVGTQRDAFARSYALINPSFTVAGFSGYCDPIAIYNDIKPNEEFDENRISKVKNFAAKSKMVKMLNENSEKYENFTKEVIFFVEQVSGHVIPDFQNALKYGIDKLIEEALAKNNDFYNACAISLRSIKVLINRYLIIIDEQIKTASKHRIAQLKYLEKSLKQIYGGPATNLYEALQLYILLWTVMCLEQAPNPYAFSLGNADRIFMPYVKDATREEVSELFKHFLVFYNVGDRSWAISQNVIIGGKDKEGNDLSNLMTYAIMDAYFDMNLPQPILSVKLHKNTPKQMYEEMGKFFFTPGALTPSLFNDDSIFEVLRQNDVDEDDLQWYSIAGCQEPLIMGKDNGNTTNSWLNLPKVLEVLLADGKSLITGEKLISSRDYSLENIREYYYELLEEIIDQMVEAANNSSKALSMLKVPFLSTFMGGLEYGYDMRDTQNHGTKYNGSGCLVHGLTVLADSFVSIDYYIKEYGDNKQLLLDALTNNFIGYEDLQKFLLSAPKFGNNIAVVDEEAKNIASKVSDILKSKTNYLGNPFRPDFSSPSTHLTYGYWVGATPDGRGSRDMLGYGVDPLYGEATNGLGFRMLSNMKLPFAKFNGGYASHLGINPKFFTASSVEEKGLEFYKNVIKPLFFNDLNSDLSPFYLYVNVTTPQTLRAVLENPKKYAPSGVYIMRIHGTFVNFLDLSPEIQQDIITRLDLNSTTICC